MGASKGTSVWSECIVTYKCNIKERNPAREGVHRMGIGVQGEGSNMILKKEIEGTSESRELGSV